MRLQVPLRSTAKSRGAQHQSGWNRLELSWIAPRKDGV